MKKKYILVILCVLAMAFAFTACGSSSDSEETEETSAAAEETTASEQDYTEFGETALANAQELSATLEEADIIGMLENNTEHCDEAKNIEQAIDAYMQEHPDITYAYLIRYTDDSKEAAEFLVNWEDTDEYWGEDFELYDEAVAALNGEAIYDSEPTTDEDGTVITGYAPCQIDGDTVLVVCVDYAVE